MNALIHKLYSVNGMTITEIALYLKISNAEVRKALR